MKNKISVGTLAAATMILSNNYAPEYDICINPQPWERGNKYKGSGTGKTGLNVSKSRAKAKAARKARKMHRSPLPGC
jgi:hypothetical protein